MSTQCILGVAALYYQSYILGSVVLQLYSAWFVYLISFLICIERNIHLTVETQSALKWCYIKWRKVGVMYCSYMHSDYLIPPFYIIIMFAYHMATCTGTVL